MNCLDLYGNTTLYMSYMALCSKGISLGETDLTAT